MRKHKLEAADWLILRFDLPLRSKCKQTGLEEACSEETPFNLAPYHRSTTCCEFSWHCHFYAASQTETLSLPKQRSLLLRNQTLQSFRTQGIHIVTDKDKQCNKNVPFAWVHLVDRVYGQR